MSTPIIETAVPEPRASRADVELAWPPLELGSWRATRETLHRFMQVVGKVELELAPPRNHYWHAALHLDARGLTTWLMPVGPRAVQLDFDFVDHVLRVRSCEEREVSIPLTGQSVASFYAATCDALHDLGFDVRLWPVPVEIADRTPLDCDTVHAEYDPDAVHRFWRALVTIEGVISRFQTDFLGKVSPVHFFWGAFDLASTRFSGRRAPPHPGAPFVSRRVMREAYSHEVASCGFWPGGEGFEEAIFYAYAYPEPPGYADAQVRPAEARYDRTLREFVLPYEAVRASRDPGRKLRAFLESTYEAAARLGQWDRAALERSPAQG